MNAIVTTVVAVKYATTPKAAFNVGVVQVIPCQEIADIVQITTNVEITTVIVVRFVLIRTVDITVLVVLGLFSQKMIRLA